MDVRGDVNPAMLTIYLDPSERDELIRQGNLEASLDGNGTKVVLHLAGQIERDVHEEPGFHMLDPYKSREGETLYGIQITSQRLKAITEQGHFASRCDPARTNFSKVVIYNKQ
jgi:hypothetical protein